MSDPCDRCPCPGACFGHRHGWTGFCGWAAEEPPDPINLAHIRARSAMPLESPAAAAYPPLAQQAGNALAAVGRVVVAAVKGEPIKVPPAVYYERLAICRDCEFNGARPAGVRCTKCGCGGMKLGLATEKCPVGKW